MPEVKLSLGWIHLTGKRINPRLAINYFLDVVKVAPVANAYFGLGMAYFTDNQRALALDMITQLKMMKQEDLANKLEKVVRENRRVILDEPKDTISDDENNQQNDKDLERTSQNPKGIKVRLRGKLNEL